MDRNTIKRVMLISITGILLFLFVAACLFVVSKLNMVNYSYKAEDSTSDIPETVYESLSESSKQNDNNEEVDDDKKFVNVLLLGTDYRLEGTSDIGRADSNIIASLNLKTGDVKLISLERGIYVPIPEGLMPYGRNSDLLTHAFHWGGPELSQNIVEKCFNINLDGYAQVDINGFAQIVDSIGGVDVEISLQEASALNGGYGASYDQIAQQYMHEGVNHFNGHDATCLCRLRSIDSDWARVERQRRVFSAIIEKAKTLNLLELNNLVDTILPLVNTNLSRDVILAVLLKVPFILGDINIEQMTVPDRNMNENHYIACDFDYESKKISNFIYGTDYELISPY